MFHPKTGLLQTSKHALPLNVLQKSLRCIFHKSVLLQSPEPVSSKTILQQSEPAFFFKTVLHFCWLAVTLHPSCPATRSQPCTSAARLSLAPLPPGFNHVPPPPVSSPAPCHRLPVLGASASFFDFQRSLAFFGVLSVILWACTFPSLYPQAVHPTVLVSPFPGFLSVHMRVPVQPLPCFPDVPLRFFCAS